LEKPVPRIRSGKKNMRKARAATVRNRGQRAALRTALKKAVSSGADVTTQRTAASQLDRAARKGLIHKNTAARQKSRIARLAKA
jgi:small subunit ribosomal protein S20